MSEEKKIIVNMNGAFPEITVEGDDEQEEVNAAELKNQEEMDNITENVPDEELEAVVDYSGAFPQVHLKRKKKEQ